MNAVSSVWAEAYCTMLTLQVEALWRHEQPILTSLPEFAAASTIVDLGAGNGAFGRRLAAEYPDKRFLGVEPDAAIYDVASRSVFPANYEYVHAGWESVAGEHDLLLARLVIMYVPDRKALYAWAREHVHAAIVVNAEDTAATMIPEPVLATVAIRDGIRTRADELASTHAGDRDLAAMPAEWTAAGFAPSGSWTVLADLSRPADRRIYHHMTRLIVQGVNPEALSLALLNELYECSIDPDGRLTIGLTYHAFRNISAANPQQLVDPVVA